MFRGGQSEADTQVVGDERGDVAAFGNDSFVHG